MKEEMRADSGVARRVHLTKELQAAVTRMATVNGRLEEGQLVSNDDPIFEKGYVDSLGFIMLLTTLEELRGAEIPEDELDLAKFTTIDSMVENYL